MTTTHVQTQLGTWSSGASWTVSITPTTGNLMVISIAFFASNGINTVASVSDSVNGAWVEIPETRIEAVRGGINEVNVMYYLKNIAGGAMTVTITATGAASEAYAEVEEVSGCDTVAPLNAKTGLQLDLPGTGTDIATTGNVTGSSGDFIYASFLAHYNPGAVSTNGTGYSNTDITNTGLYGAEYIANFVGGSIAGKFTTNSNLDWNLGVATFKAAAGSSATFATNRTMIPVAGPRRTQIISL